MANVIECLIVYRLQSKFLVCMVAMLQHSTLLPPKRSLWIKLKRSWGTFRQLLPKTLAWENSLPTPLWRDHSKKMLLFQLPRNWTWALLLATSSVSIFVAFIHTFPPVFLIYTYHWLNCDFRAPCWEWKTWQIRCCHWPFSFHDGCIQRWSCMWSHLSQGKKKIYLDIVQIL